MKSLHAVLAVATLLATALVYADGTQVDGRDRGAVGHVTSGADNGPGSLRLAVEWANTDASVRTIRLDRGVDIELLSPVVYDGSQNLQLSGHGNSISGAKGDSSLHTTWDAGLFVSRSAGDLTISRLRFLSSFNNGVAIFVPADAEGTVRVELHDTLIAGSKFHGLFFDDQSSSGFNTDDVLHPNCVDPHPSESNASLSLAMRRSAIVANGTLMGGFDDSTAKGCPRDFDGVRVDEGSTGGIAALFAHTIVTDNLADGVELDELESGGVTATAIGSAFNFNGAAGSTIDGLTDLDDGFDIDEGGPGSLEIRFHGVSIDDNLDEGLDLDEAGDGDVMARLVTVTTDRNQDEGVKINEEDSGSLDVRLIRSSASGSAAEAGVALAETGSGDVSGRIVRTAIVGNAGSGIAAEQLDDGSGRLVVVASDLSGNADGPIDAAGVVVQVIRTNR